MIASKFSDAKDRLSISVARGSWCHRAKTKKAAASVKVLERRCCKRCWLDMARILIVDTQTDVRHALVRLLEQKGHSTTAVATIAEATGILAMDVPDLLATDVVLTDGSSTSLVKQAQTAGAKTLMMTGSPDRIVEFDGSGQPYLSKPFPPEAFLQRVEQILSPG
jgi:DNA-binding NtrC family response regulator